MLQHICEDFGFMAYAGRHDLIQRHGHSALAHMWPSSHGETALLPADSVRTRPGGDEVEVEWDASESDCKRLRAMNPTMMLLSATSPATVPDLRKLQEVVKNASETSSAAISAYSIPFNPLDEPSPLGLTLRKTPSLLDLIQMKLVHNDVEMPRYSYIRSFESSISGRKSSSSISQQEKLKASNFPASILRIGTWEHASRYEGDLIAKCYYAKRKLVWEVLENGLKSKIEIQWSDIIALEASRLESEPGILEIEVSRPPLFFKETDPQPRKHTLWQATSDFTGGQATVCKLHYLRFPPGLLNRHYERLIHSDPHLRSLSEKGLLSRDSDYFEQCHEKLEIQLDRQKFELLQQDEKHHGSPVVSGHLHPYPSFHVLLNSNDLQHAGIILKHEPIDLGDTMHEPTTESPSKNSDMDSQAHGNSNRTITREDFHLKVHIADSAKPENQNCQKARNLYLDPISECTDVDQTSLYPSTSCGGASTQIFDELAYHLLAEFPYASFQ